MTHEDGYNSIRRTRNKKYHCHFDLAPAWAWYLDHKAGGVSSADNQKCQTQTTCPSGGVGRVFGGSLLCVPARSTCCSVVVIFVVIFLVGSRQSSFRCGRTLGSQSVSSHFVSRQIRLEDSHLEWTGCLQFVCQQMVSSYLVCSSQIGFPSYDGNAHDATTPITTTATTNVKSRHGTHHKHHKYSRPWIPNNNNNKPSW